MITVELSYTAFKVPGFAFVRFLDPDSVARVLDSKPIKLFGDHRLNVQRQESWVRYVNDLINLSFNSRVILENEARR